MPRERKSTQATVIRHKVISLRASRLSAGALNYAKRFSQASVSDTATISSTACSKLTEGETSHSRLRSVIEVQAPLAIKAGEIRIASIEEFEKFWIKRMCHCPAAAACKITVLLCEVTHHVARQNSVEGNGSATPRIVEKAIENVLRESRLAADLHYLSYVAWFQVVDIPADSPLAIVA
jgi:hypothetical protein